jgi:hypothetical protein
VPVAVTTDARPSVSSRSRCRKKSADFDGDADTARGEIASRCSELPVAAVADGRNTPLARAVGDANTGCGGAPPPRSLTGDRADSLDADLADALRDCAPGDKLAAMSSIDAVAALCRGLRCTGMGDSDGDNMPRFRALALDDARPSDGDRRSRPSGENSKCGGVSAAGCGSRRGVATAMRPPPPASDRNC